MSTPQQARVVVPEAFFKLLEAARGSDDGALSSATEAAQSWLDNHGPGEFNDIEAAQAARIRDLISEVNRLEHGLRAMLEAYAGKRQQTEREQWHSSVKAAVEALENSPGWEVPFAFIAISDGYWARGETLDLAALGLKKQGAKLKGRFFIDLVIGDSKPSVTSSGMVEYYGQRIRVGEFETLGAFLRNYIVP